MVPLWAAERMLRHYDKALRLRRSLEDPGLIHIERKTFRGRIGSLGPAGLLWRPDTGRRREEGHVHVGSIHRAVFDTPTLLSTLKEADTWRRWDQNAYPLWRRVEEADESAQARRKRHRQADLRYKASELFDRYAWRYGMRVRVPERIA